MVHLQPDERAEELLGPVEVLLARALACLPDAPPLAVRVETLPERSDGGAPFYLQRGDTVLLSDALCGPALSHPNEAHGPLPPMDRWRRACGCVLEAACARELSLRVEKPIEDDWRWWGAAIAAADRLAPELGLDLPDIALAVTTGSPGRYPRAGAAVMRAWRAFGLDPVARVQELLEGSIVSATEWLKIGSWVFARDGGIALLPVVVARAAEITPPATIPEWSWRSLRADARPKGIHLAIDGDGAIAEAWAAREKPIRTIIAAASTPVTIREGPGAPIGQWEVASAEGFGQVMGARGIQFHFYADGRFEIVLADAFVGPLAAVAMADQLGTSGLCEGHWSIAGEQKLNFTGIESRSLTLHGRSRDRFLMPARGFGIGEWIDALGEEVWDWQATAPAGGSERLVMRGRMMGGGVEVRLKR